MTWLAFITVLLKVAGGILGYLQQSQLTKAGADAEQAKRHLAVVQNITRARRAVDRARADAGQLRKTYRRK